MNARGFVLLEALIAVAIFAVGVIGIAECINHCTAAERLRQEEALASRALENRMMEIETNAAPFQSPGMDDLNGVFRGMKLSQETKPLRMRNESGQELAGLYSISLTVLWTSSGSPRERTLTFYVQPRQF